MIAHALLEPFSVLPGIAFSLDLIETTNQYGVAEVLLSSFMAAFIFSVFGAQPLTIAGVTGAHIHESQYLEILLTAIQAQSLSSTKLSTISRNVILILPTIFNLLAGCISGARSSTGLRPH
jgi:hypothetical protein